MRWVIVKVHVTCVWVFSKDAFIELSHFAILLYILLMIAVILVHHLTSELHHFNVRVSHVQKNGRTHDHKSNINPKVISGEDKELARIVIELVFHHFFDFVDLL